ncbi:MAG: polysaccharide deacetylase family protein [Bacteroidales bacterium]|nr:polysaccharide deacetylase family protein [Bacteroidales bacterium]
MSAFVYKALRYSGVAWIWRETVQRGRVTFLLFHDMELCDAERNFSYLKKHYHIISLKQYVDAVRNQSVLPKKAVVVTFDDGHVSNYKLLPIIKKLNVPVTVFLCSSIVGTRRHFWFRHSEVVKHKVESLKQLSTEERLRVLQTMGFIQAKEYDDRQALSSKEIEEMKTVVDFQSHTCFHPILPQCDDTTAREEIVSSKLQLESLFGLDIYALSYPNGDYSDRDIKLAKEAGYQCGITVDSGYNNRSSDLFRLKRFSVNDAKSITELMVKASGIYALIKHKLHKPSYGYKPSRA